MDIPAYVFAMVGFFTLVTGIVFFFVHRNVKKYSSHSVKDKITGLTWNAAVIGVLI